MDISSGGTYNICTETYPRKFNSGIQIQLQCDMLIRRQTYVLLSLILFAEAMSNSRAIFLGSRYPVFSKFFYSKLVYPFQGTPSFSLFLVSLLFPSKSACFFFSSLPHVLLSPICLIPLLLYVCTTVVVSFLRRWKCIVHLLIPYQVYITGRRCCCSFLYHDIKSRLLVSYVHQNYSQFNVFKAERDRPD